MATKWLAAKWLAFCQLVGRRRGSFQAGHTKNVGIESLSSLARSHQERMPRTKSWDILSRPWTCPDCHVYPGLRPGLLSAVPAGLCLLSCLPRTDATFSRFRPITFFDWVIWTALSENKSATRPDREQSRRACPKLVEGDDCRVPHISLVFREMWGTRQWSENQNVV